MADDYLDAFGDEKVFGKPIGGDIINDKKSWLITRALEKTPDRDALFAKMAMPAGTPEERAAKIDAVRGEYVALGVDCDAKTEIGRLTALAMESAARLGLDSGRFGMLSRFADSLVGRAK